MCSQRTVIILFSGPVALLLRSFMFCLLMSSQQIISYLLGIFLSLQQYTNDLVHLERVN